MIQDEITPCTRMTMSPINRDLLVVIIAVASGLMLLFFASYAHAEPKADLTNTGVSSARLYWDTAQISTGGGFFDVRGVKIPVAVSVFPDEIYAAPKSWTEKAKLIYYNRLPKGGHFAAWEQPQLFSEEIRAAFRLLR